MKILYYANYMTTELSIFKIFPNSFLSIFPSHCFNGCFA